MPRLFIVEDQALVLEGYLMLFELADDLVVAGSAPTAAEALAAIPAAAPDLVMTDLSLPDMHGLELVRRLSVPGGPPAVLVVSGHDDDGLRREAAEAGACGFVLKQDGPDHLLDAIRAAVSG